MTAVSRVGRGMTPTFLGGGVAGTVGFIVRIELEDVGKMMVGVLGRHADITLECHDRSRKKRISEMP